VGSKNVHSPPQTFTTFCFKLIQYYKIKALTAPPPKSQTLFAPMIGTSIRGIFGTGIPKKRRP